MFKCPYLVFFLVVLICFFQVANIVKKNYLQDKTKHSSDDLFKCSNIIIYNTYV